MSEDDNEESLVIGLILLWIVAGVIVLWCVSVK